MNINLAVDRAVSFIADREGFSPVAYYDINGWAIGYGNHYYANGSLVSEGDTITRSAADSLLQYYAMQNAQAILGQLRVPVTENQLAALVSLRYNCGTITTALLNLINSGASSQAITDQFAATCVTSGGVYNPDLAERRQLEIGLYNSSGMTVGLIPIILAGLVAWVVVGSVK